MELPVSDEGREYELTFLLKEEDTAPVRDIIVSHGGVVSLERPLVKVRLEYLIQKTEFAFCGVLRFRMEAAALSRFGRDLGLLEGLLRFLITKPSPFSAPQVVPDEGKVKKEVRAPEAIESVAPPPRRPEREMVMHELTNEALERKIEEILQ